jgi:hypothetical protein
MLRQCSDLHAWVVADQAAEIVGVAGEDDCWAGAERGRSDEGVYCVAGIELVFAQQVASSAGDRSFGVNYGHSPQYPIDLRAARGRAGQLRDHRSWDTGLTTQPLDRDEYSLCAAAGAGSLTGEGQREQRRVHGRRELP